MDQLSRPATFEGHGAITVQGLVHVLCSHDLQHLACMEWLLAKMGQPSRSGENTQPAPVRSESPSAELTIVW